MRRVAVIGSGIAGLSVAHTLADDAHITLFEAGPWFGGHAHTVDVTLEGTTHGVDTGFLVLNERTYPQLLRLFAELGVATAPSDMSFSVQAPAQGLEWSGSDLNTVFAQRSNLLRPRFWAMLIDILRFNRLATALALQLESPQAPALLEPIADFLARHRFGQAFREGYFLPMIGCIWSCPTDQMLRFPVATLVRFCHNHGLLQVNDRPQWHTVRGGARHYIERILQRVPDARLATPVLQVRRLGSGARPAGVQVLSSHGWEHFDEVVLACHSDQSLALLAEPTVDEVAVLGAIRYQPNRAVLHTDTAVMPRRRLAWAAWNYERARDAGQEEAGVCLHYWINQLQPLPWQTPVIVSLNPTRAIAPEHQLGAWDYDHPVFDAAAVMAQARVPSLQGQGGLWYCGAWTRYGFHEDGLRSGLAVAEGLRRRWAGQAAAPAAAVTPAAAQAAV